MRRWRRRWRNKASIITWISRNVRRNNCEWCFLLHSHSFGCLLRVYLRCIYNIIAHYEVWMLFSTWYAFNYHCHLFPLVLRLTWFFSRRHRIVCRRQSHRIKPKCWRDKINTAKNANRTDSTNSCVIERFSWQRCILFHSWGADFYFDSVDNIEIEFISSKQSKAKNKMKMYICTQIEKKITGRSHTIVWSRFFQVKKTELKYEFENESSTFLRFSYLFLYKKWARM